MVRSYPRRCSLGRRAAGSALTVAALHLSACALFHRLSFESPTVDLQTVEVTGLGLTGGSLNLLLDVYNPNSYELRTVQMAAALVLEDTHFGDALLPRVVTLPATAHEIVEVPVTFTWAGVGAGAKALLLRGAVNYRLDTTIDIDRPVERTVNLATGGQVPLKDLVR